MRGGLLFYVSLSRNVTACLLEKVDRRRLGWMVTACGGDTGDIRRNFLLATKNAKNAFNHHDDIAVNAYLHAHP